MLKEIVLNTDTQNSLELTAEKTPENSGEKKKESTKSNSELMAEFFSVDLDADSSHIGLPVLS